MKYIIAFFMIFSIGDIAFSISLEHLIEIAKEKNRNIIIDDYDFQESKEEVKASGYLNNPMIGFGFDENMRMYQFTQNIPFPNKLINNRKIAYAKKDLALITKDAQIDNVIFQLKNVYYDWYFTNEILKLKKEQEKLIENMISVLETKYINNLIPQQVLIQAYLDFELMKESIKKIEIEQIESIKINLKFLIGDGSIELDNPQKPNISLEDNLLDDRIRKNSMLKSLYKKTDINELALHQKKLNYLPDFSFSLTREYMPDMDNTNYKFMFGMSLPLWVNVKNAEYQKAELNLKKSKLLERDYETKLQSDIEKYLLKSNELARKEKLYTSRIIPLAEQIFELNSTDYSTNKSSFENVVKSLNEVINRKIEFINIKHEQAKNINIIEKSLSFYNYDR